jgi:hypothetical protein
VGAPFVEGTDCIKLLQLFRQIGVCRESTFARIDMTNRTRSFLLIPILGFAATTAPAADKTFDKHFNAAPGGRLILDTDIGAITIVGHDSRDLAVHVDISGSDADQVKVTADQTGSGVTVLGRTSASHHLFGFSGTRVSFTIDVPHDYPVELKTSGGSIEVRNLSAETRGTTSGGSIELRDVAGPINMSTSGGSVEAENLNGPTKLRSSGGSIEVTNAIGSLEVSTSGGGLQLVNVDGKISGETSGGGVHVEARSNHGITLSTSGGSISVLLPADVHASIDAQTSAGRVRMQLPLSSTELSETSHLRGEMNGGGERISLHTSAGGIEIGPLGH